MASACGDEGLLRSAIATAQMTFGGNWLHGFPHGMARAYAFHICANHPFVDGKKRTAFAAALFFLDVDGFDLDCTEQEAEELVLSVRPRRDREGRRYRFLPAAREASPARRYVISAAAGACLRDTERPLTRSAPPASRSSPVSRFVTTYRPASSTP